MEQEHQTRHQQSSNYDVGPSVSSSSNVSEHPVEEAEYYNELHHVAQEQYEHQQQQQQQPSTDQRRGRQHWQPRYMMQRFRFSALNFNDTTADVWSCTVIILTFWFFGSMILILGFYGTYNLQLGPNCSYEIQANPFFVHSIKAQQLDDQTEGPILYGFNKYPSLDVKTTWSQSYITSVDPDLHREWTYFLNAGSRVLVHYDVKSPSSDTFSLVIAQGRENLLEWIDNPSYPNITLSWNIVHGSGNITLNITESDTYYIAVGNLNKETVEVHLNITIWSLLYNTSNANFRCSLSNHVCSFNLILLNTNVAVLTTPNATQGDADNNWYIQVSYGPQWLTYCSTSCIVTVLILAIFKNRSQSQSNTPYNAGNQSRENAEREPLLSPKSEDHSSMGSSYESLSNDEEDLEENIAEGCIEGKVSKDGKSNARRLCAICFDAPKDCFFVPCGHSAACFTCGSRIAEEAGICPICRRKLKKVRKIFSV